MFDQRKDHQLEELVDTLLSEYSAVSPRAGLESRILCGLRARADRPRRGWSLAFAMAGAAVLMVGLVTDWRPKPASSSQSTKALAVAPISRHGKEATPSSLPRTARNAARSGNQNRSNPPNLIQVADAMHGKGRLIFVQEKLYLSPAADPEPAPATEQETVAPSISIRELEVQPIAIKELTAEKEADEKGKP